MGVSPVGVGCSSDAIEAACISLKKIATWPSHYTPNASTSSRSPPTDESVEVGDVGTVVELPPPDGVEVESPDRNGRTCRVAILTISDGLVLNRDRTYAT
ncbi:MAG: hypothetical protein RLZZ536_971 [Planctomycetota bacterium]|jgi:hypothetical protein